MTKAVIFDLDGTLVDLPIDYDKLFKDFGKLLKTADVRPVTKTISRLDEKTKNEVFKCWEKIELEALLKMTLKIEGLELVKQYSGKKKALVTMQGKILAQNALKRLGISFDSIVTRENSLDRAEQLKIAAQQLKTPIKDVLFIGNTEEDSQAAKKIGCEFLRVKT